MNDTELKEYRADLEKIGEAPTRLKWKDRWAQAKYGKSYISICCGAKDDIDQMYETFKLEEEQRSCCK